MADKNDLSIIKLNETMVMYGENKLIGVIESVYDKEKNNPAVIVGTFMGRMMFNLSDVVIIKYEKK